MFFCETIESTNVSSLLPPPLSSPPLPLSSPPPPLSSPPPPLSFPLLSFPLAALVSH